MTFYQNPADLLARVRSRADMVNSTFLTDAEIDSYVVEEIYEAYDILIESAGQDSLAWTTGSNPTVAGTSAYQIYLVASTTLAPIYKILWVEVQFDGAWRRVRPYEAWEATDLAHDDGGWHAPEHVFYRTTYRTVTGFRADQAVGWDIEFIPEPQGVHNFRVHYIPAFTGFTGTNEVQGFYGLNEFVLAGAAAKCLEKAEKYAAADRQIARRDRAEARLRRHAQTTNLDRRDRVRDTSTTFGNMLNELWPDLYCR